MDRIIVSVTLYNNDIEVLEFGEQLANQSYADKIIYLVTINSAKDEKLFRDELDKVRIETHIYNPLENLGYLNGCLYGIKQYNIINKDYCYVICNTDLYFPDCNMFRKIAENMVVKQIWCLGPSIRKHTGEFQNPFLMERPSEKKVKIWGRIQGNSYMLVFYTLISRLKRRIKKKTIKAESQNVYAVHGSFFVLNNLCIIELLNVKNKIFMYGEEILIAEICRNNNGIVRYTKEIDVIHNENATTRIVNSRNKANWYRESFDYIHYTYFDNKS